MSQLDSGKDPKSKKPIFKKWWFWVAVVLVVGGIAGAGRGGASSQTSAPAELVTETPKAPEPIQAPPKIGDVVNVGNAEVTIISAKIYQKFTGDYGATTPAEGAVYVGVVYKLKNTSGEPMGAFSVPIVRIKDGTGVTYSTDLKATGAFSVLEATDGKILSNLNPGITVKDANAYELSTESLKSPGWSIEIAGNETVSVPVSF